MTHFKRICMTVLGTMVVVSSVTADQVILDDLIVDGSACIGQDCVNGESFGFDTIRIKENNLRIKFQDTSSTARFPSSDWELTANDSSNGGQNRFSITDVSGGRVPFTIEATAPSHSLYVDDGGRVGLGTNAPVVELHVVDGDTPTLRLQQDGSSGFTPQTWDLAGNETNFFLRDVTNGSTLPFRVRPGAPTSAIDIQGSGAIFFGGQSAAAADMVITSGGDVGIGTGTPTAPLHVASDGTAAIHIQDTSTTNAVRDMMQFTNNGTMRFQFADTSTAAPANDWSMAFETEEFELNRAGGSSPGIELRLNMDGDLTIRGGLISAGGGGACTTLDPCDGVFAPDFEVESIEEHSAFMWENSYLRAIGPTAEKGPFNVTQKTGGLINELEKAHIFIERLNKDLKSKDNLLMEMQTRLARLEEILEKNN